MADRDEGESRSLLASAVPVGAFGAALLVAAAFCGLLKGVYPDQGPLLDFLTIASGSFGGALLSIAVSGLWWNDVTRRETQDSLVKAVALTFEQDPALVARLFQEKMILQFVRNNIAAQTEDPALAKAVADYLLGPFIQRDSSMRIRSGQTYDVRMDYQDAGQGAAEGSGHALWRVRELLEFDERLPLQESGPNVLLPGPRAVVAAFVFQEASLAPWFKQRDCIYRTVSHVPVHLRDPGASVERQAWATEWLDCELHIAGERIPLSKDVSSLASADCAQWSVQFAIDDEAAMERAREAAARRGGRHLRDVNVKLVADSTWPSERRDYTAYLAYPTQGPGVTFGITHPAQSLECAHFYNAGAKVTSRPLDTNGLSVEVDEGCWVFPVSGAVFTWSMSAEVPAAISCRTGRLEKDECIDSEKKPA